MFYSFWINLIYSCDGKSEFSAAITPENSCAVYVESKTHDFTEFYDE